MNFAISYLQRENRFLNNINSVFLFLPFILLPLMFEWYLHLQELAIFSEYKHEILLGNIAYIVIVRFLLLDTAIYIFSRSKHTTHIALIQVVLLYLEITVVTILYYAIVFHIFDVFTLFHLSAKLTPENLKDIHEHSLINISTVTFTTLGSGDWIPQTLSAMIAVVSEVILGVIQGGIFVAIIIYAHQNRKN
ncbi:MAG: metal transporter [Campylobacterales bacterium]